MLEAEPRRGVQRAATARVDRVDVGPGAQQHERGLIADFDARARHQRHAAMKRSALVALGVVELRAGRAHGVVEKVQLPELGLADVAKARLLQLPLLLRRLAD